MKYRRLEIRLIPGKDDDLIIWLEMQDNQTEAIREACRCYLQQAKSPTLQMIYETVQQIEKRLTSGIQISELEISSIDEDPELAAALDALGEE